MRYSLRTNTSYEHLAKKFERAVWQFVYEDLLFVGAFQRTRKAITSSLVRSVMSAQICRLIEGSPHQDQWLEISRATCVSQPREMINLFFAPFKSMTTEQRMDRLDRIGMDRYGYDRALDRLRQRYGVSSGFLSEPKVLEIPKGSKITHSITSLK